MIKEGLLIPAQIVPSLISVGCLSGTLFIDGSAGHRKIDDCKLDHQETKNIQLTIGPNLMMSAVRLYAASKPNSFPVHR